MVLELTKNGVLLGGKPVGPTGRKERLDYYQGGCLAIDRLEIEDKATYSTYNRIVAGHSKEWDEHFRTGLLETVNTLVHHTTWPMNAYYRLRTNSKEMNEVMEYNKYYLKNGNLYLNDKCVLLGATINELEYMENLAKSYSRMELDLPANHKEFNVGDLNGNKLLDFILDVYLANKHEYLWFTDTKVLLWDVDKEETTGLIFV